MFFFQVVAPMPRFRRSSDPDQPYREQLRRSHEARERQARRAVKRATEELVWLRHRLRFRCAGCGRASTRPYVENEGSPFAEEVVNWDRPDDLLACSVCGRWLCRRCGPYVVGIGARCRIAGPDCR
jgi:hypothetical protein